MLAWLVAFWWCAVRLKYSNLSLLIRSWQILLKFHLRELEELSILLIFIVSSIVLVAQVSVLCLVCSLRHDYLSSCTFELIPPLFWLSNKQN